VQGLFAGATSYTDQTPKDMLNDIEGWIKKSKEIKAMFENTINELNKTGYWTEKVDYDFRMFCHSISKITETFIYDFSVVKDALEEDEIMERHIKILKNIRSVVYENEEFCVKTYNDESRGYWHDCGNEDFAKVEKLYQEGRDYLVTLKDVGNMASRLEDYMRPEGNVVNITKTDNSIHVGDKNKFNKSVIHNNIANDEKEFQKRFFERHPWISGLVISIVAGLILMFPFWDKIVGMFEGFLR